MNAKKKDHYQIWQGRNPDGGYGGGVPECRIYYRPWWQKKEQRNREAMEENEYMKSLMRGERWPAGRIPG